MEGANVITFSLMIFETAEFLGDYFKWAKASFAPMLMSTGYFLGVERGVPIEDKLISRRRLSIGYYKDLESYLAHMATPEQDAYYKDINTTWGGKFERSSSTYLVVRRLKGVQSIPINKGDIVDKDTYLKEFAEGSEPIVLLRGLGLNSDDWEKYDAWVKEWGYKIYIPLLLKIPGVIEYCRCWLSNVWREGPVVKPGITINTEYPQDLSIIYFENLKAYQNFQKSKELEVYDKNLAAAFPGGLNYKWNNAFQLMVRFSK